MSDQTNLNNTIDSSIVSYSRAKTYMNTIFGSSFLTLLLIVGVFILIRSIKNKDNNKSTEAKILSIKSNGKNIYSANITYTILDKSYENVIELNFYRNIGSFITIYYNIDNPNIIVTTSPIYEIFIGMILIVCVLLSCILMFFNAYMVRNSDIAAQDAVYRSYGKRSSMSSI